jgi:hypothetical protein
MTKPKKIEEKPKRGHHPNTKKNLKPPFQKGDPNIPKSPGRPPISEEEKAIRNLNHAYLTNLHKKGEYDKALDDILKVQRKQGRHDLLKFIYESVNGKPNVMIGTVNNEPIEIRFVD